MAFYPHRPSENTYSMSARVGLPSTPSCLGLLTAPKLRRFCENHTPGLSDRLIRDVAAFTPPAYARHG